MKEHVTTGPLDPRPKRGTQQHRRRRRTGRQVLLGSSHAQVSPLQKLVIAVLAGMSLVTTLVLQGMMYASWPPEAVIGEFDTGDTTSNHYARGRPLIPGVFRRRNPNDDDDPKTDPNGEQSPAQDRIPNPKSDTNSTRSQTTKDNGRARVVELLQQAGVESLTREQIQQLPTWQQVLDLYGPAPRLYTEKGACTTYQARVPPTRRMVGAAGMFSTGTNLVTTLLKKNCQILERVELFGVNATREQHGMRWQVPWGKHTQQQYREKHSTEQAKAIVKDDLLPVVTIRHPIAWMKSMCKNPYTAKWQHRRDECPNLQSDENEWNQVSVKYGAGSESYQSLAHLYNDWYHGYTKHAQYPWIMIRMEGTYSEGHFFTCSIPNRNSPLMYADANIFHTTIDTDLVFHAHETIQQVCECAGGKLIHADRLQYTLESAKADSPGHDTSTGLVEAWIKYGQAPQVEGWSSQDIAAVHEALDPELLQLFGYELPPIVDG
mmetsp:Transcript_22489/g.46858  ORF Transcript_22489/g.46858 Transcript_22489/m.46858 type:complete len:490 (-) Transcript_22489:1133-2602(-)